MRGLGRSRSNTRRVRRHDLNMADRADRRAVARAHARCPHDTHISAEPLRQFGEQTFRAFERAG